MHPTWYRRFDPKVPNRERVDQVLAWLRLPPDSAPALVLLYMGDVDEAGHAFGPDAPQEDSAIARVDSAIGRLQDGLSASGLTDLVDILVVSDHGMVATDSTRTIYVDDYLDPRASRSRSCRRRCRSGRAKAASTASTGRWRAATPTLPCTAEPICPPASTSTARPGSPPIVALAAEGWLVTTHERARTSQPPRGMHGYDPDLPSMQALFLARGPSFRRGAVVPGFENVHVYPLLAELLGVRPAPPTAGSTRCPDSLSDRPLRLPTSPR
jgi:predicted AlkP superfamily pyrophosphatase or phosphodiesterase